MPKQPDPVQISRTETEVGTEGQDAQLEAVELTEWREFMASHPEYHPAVLLEREGELQQLTSMLENLPVSGGRVVLIRGEAGIGKSALVAEFSRLCSDRAHFIFGWCDDLSTPEPLGALFDIGRAETSVARAITSGDRMSIMDALLDLMSRKLRPTVMVLEDMHWADQATLDIVNHVGRRITRTNGLLILTYRDGEVDLDHPLRKVIGQIQPDALERINLSRLSRNAVASLISAAVFDVQEVIELTAGNPLFVKELIAGAPGRVPASIQDSVLGRAARLSTGARDLLELVSVVPGRCEQRLIEAVIDASAADLAECVRQGLLKVEAGEVFYPHELARRAVESALDAAKRQDLNRRVLETLRGEASASRLVHHAVGAGDSDAIVEFAPIAARSAVELGSLREASAHFRSLEPFLNEVPLDVRAGLLDDWSRVEFYIDRAEAIPIVERAIGLYRSSGDVPGLVRALTFAVRMYETGGRPAEAERCMNEALETVEHGPDGPELASALAQRGWLAMMRSQFDLALEFADRAFEMAERLGDESTSIYSLNTRGSVLYMQGDLDGREALEAARSRAERSGFRFEEVRALKNMTSGAYEVMDLDAAAEYAQRARDLAVRYELDAFEANCQADYAELLMMKGDWVSAEALVIDAMETNACTAVTAHLILGKIQMRSGRPEAWGTLLEAWRLAEESAEPQALFPSAAALAEAIWVAGEDLPGSLPRLTDLAGMSPSGLLRARGELAFWLWKIGELGREPADVYEPYALIMSGDSRAAAAVWEGYGLPYERAIALTHTDTAGRIEALAILDGLGAAAVAGKVRKALRDDGIAPPRGKGLATRRNAAGLTARQAEVLELLDEGLTNAEIADRLFVSSRTVENHVSMILAKLEVSSRDDAVASARAAGLLRRGQTLGLSRV